MELIVFGLISGCDLDSPRKVGSSGETSSVVDGQTPLHLAASWGLEKVAKCLLEHNAQINLQVSEMFALLEINLS